MLNFVYLNLDTIGLNIFTFVFAVNVLLKTLLFSLNFSLYF